MMDRAEEFSIVWYLSDRAVDHLDAQTRADLFVCQRRGTSRDDHRTAAALYGHRHVACPVSI